MSKVKKTNKTHESALQELHIDWFEAFFQSVEDGFIFFSTESDILFANPKVDYFFGKSDVELIGKSINECGVLGSLILPDLKKVLTTKIPLTTGYTLKQDPLEVFEASYSPFFDVNNEALLGAALVFRDISNQKRLLLELKKAQNAIKNQAKALQYFDIFAEADLFGNMTFVNDEFCKVSGYPKEELVGQNFKILNSGYHSAKFFSKLWKTILKKNPWSGTIKNKTKDGSFVWGETIITPELDDKGNLKKFLMFQKDVTQQKTRAELAQDFLLRFKEACLHCPITFLNLDLTGKVVFSNYHFSDLTGVSIENIEGKHFTREFIDYEGRQAVEIILLKVLSNKHGESRRFRSSLLCADQSLKTIEWRASLSLDEKGYPHGISLIGQDLTKTLKEKDKIGSIQKEAVNEKKKTMAFLSHQLKGGLLSIEAGIELLKEEVEEKTIDIEQVKGLLEKVEKKLDSVNHLNQTFLNSFKMDGKFHQLTPQKIDYRVVIDGFLKDLQKNNVDKAIKVSSEYCEDPEFVWWDPTVFEEIVKNVLSNAVKYSHPNQIEIHVKSKKQDENIILQFEDKGKGMSLEQANTVFNMFERAQDHEKIEGHGVGLKFCKDMVELHQGKIWLDTQKDKGTIFFVKLPVRAHEQI